MDLSRLLLGGLVAGGVAAGAAVYASAQDPTAPPTVTLKATKAAVTSTGTAGLVAGPTRFEITTPAHRTVALGLLRPGKTAADLKAAIAKSKRDAGPILKVARLIGGGGSSDGHSYVFTTDLAAGTYEVVDDTDKPVIRSEFTVGPGSNGATAPTPDATITMDDFAIHSGALPATGSVAIKNDGPSPHFLVLARLKAPGDAGKVVAALRKGGKSAEAAFKLVDARTEGELLDLVSSGVTDVVETQSLKPGKWLLACFYADARSHGKEHTMLGMERVVTVK